MPLWKMTLSYDGTDFHGWQVQPGVPTVQGTLRDAIQRITGEDTLPQGAGRTDAGVHARGQVASVELASAIPAANLQRALNGLLPAAIRVLSVEGRERPFHARHSARQKTYEYRIFPRRAPALRGRGPLEAAREQVCDPTLARFVWDCSYELDVAALNRAAAAVRGTHDFTSFAATARPGETEMYVPADPLPGYASTPPTPCRTITASLWTCEDGLLLYRVVGSGFLHHMVRNLVGTFVLAGSGRLDAGAIPDILAARSRSVAGPTAPARGLFLVSVVY